MAFLEGSLEKMQEEETAGGKIRSERMFQKLGININELIKRNIFDLGDIFPSLLDETDFASEHDVTWQLCDGSNIEGSTLNALTGISFAPDLRGRFLRQQNPESTGLDASRALNSTQVNDNSLHTHFILQLQRSGGALSLSSDHSVRNILSQIIVGDYRLNASNNAPDTGQTAIVTEAVATTEARPENRSINYYLKIDDL